MSLVDIKVPQLSESITEATLLNWKKQPGQAVALDEILIEVETDKVVMEVPAPAAGVLAEILVADGATVTAEQVTEWSAAYPAVDVEQQLREMRAWCIANKSNRKTQRGVERFIVRWLGREQDSGARQSRPQQAGFAGVL